MNNQREEWIEIINRARQRSNSNKPDGPTDINNRSHAVPSPIDIIFKKYSPASKKVNQQRICKLLNLFTDTLGGWTGQLLVVLSQAQQNGTISPYYENRDDKVVNKLVDSFLDNINTGKLGKQLKFDGIDFQFKSWLKNYCNEAALKEIKRFRKDYQHKYNKKNRENISDTVKKAQKGSTDALCKLIAWDKTWLYVDWVKERVLAAQSVDDKNFLKLISQSLARTSRVHERTEHPQWFMRFKFFKDSGIKLDSKFVKEIFEHLCTYEYTFPEELRDLPYFRKFLKRHDLT